MWVAMNDSFVSIVADRNDPDGVVVRARKYEDLVAFEPFIENKIIESNDSDYRFRVFIQKRYAAEIMFEKTAEIDYDNFKNSVKEGWRKNAYMSIWTVMNKVQETFYGVQDYWLNYRNQ